MTPKVLHEGLRNRYLKMVTEFLQKEGEEVLITGTNEVAIPCVDAEGNDEFLVLNFKVPKGSRDGEAYDGYAVAEDFAMNQKAKEEKRVLAEKKKAEKIARDTAMREAKAKAKEKRA